MYSTGQKPEHTLRGIAASCCANAAQVALLAACKQQGIPVLCVTGAGAKADPTRLRIVDVCESNADPLARAVRTR